MKINILENKVNLYFFFKLSKNEINLCKNFAEICSLNKTKFFQFIISTIFLRGFLIVYLYFVLYNFSKKSKFHKNYTNCVAKNMQLMSSYAQMMPFSYINVHFNEKIFLRKQQISCLY